MNTNFDQKSSLGRKTLTHKSTINKTENTVKKKEAMQGLLNIIKRSGTNDSVTSEFMKRV